jgi:TRAP-type mannitol/chloroaromatic compound transport system permease small subunit
VSKVLAIVAGAAAAAMVLMVVADVVMRRVANSPVAGTLEYVAFWWLPLLVIFALAITEAESDHIRVTLAEDGMRGLPRKVLVVVRQTLVLLVTAALAYFSLQGALHSFDIGETTALGTNQVAIWPVKCMAVLGWTWFSVQSLSTLVALLRIQTETSVDSIDAPSTQKVGS